MNINLYYAETAMHVAQESKETDPSITVTDDCIIANTPYVGDMYTSGIFH